MDDQSGKEANVEVQEGYQVVKKSRVVGNVILEILAVEAFAHGGAKTRTISHRLLNYTPRSSGLCVEIVMEEAPVGDHQENGVAENAAKNVQSQLRVLKNALEVRINRRAEGDRQAVPWMVIHAATVISVGRKGDEGFTACRRWKGREFARPVAEFGESVIYTYLPAPRSERTSSMSEGRPAFGLGSR